jgi:hypothetical protein
MRNSTLQKKWNAFKPFLKACQGAKALVMLAVLVLSSMFALAQNGQIDLRSESKAEITRSEFTTLRAVFSYSSIESIEVATERGTFSEITLPGTYPSGEIGSPELPATHQLLAVPMGATPHVRVINYTTKDYRLSEYGINTIMPHQPSVRKDQRPEDIEFVYNATAYQTRALATAPEATIEVQGTMRGIRIGSLVINPVSYNPASNTLRVFNNIEVEVSFEGADYAETERMLVNTYSPYFDIVYKQMFNYRQILDVYSDHPDLMAYPVHMIVITPENYMSALQPWINWKIQKGFDVNVYTTSQTGTTYSAIRSYVQNLYNTGVNQGATPTFLILVGDVAQVPNTTGSSTSKVTDLYYGSVDSDYFPDMFYSRMSAENTTQLTAIVDKILQYEQYTMSAPSYLNNVTLIAGWDSYWTSYVGAPTINYATTYYYNTAHGFNTVNSHVNQNQYSGCYNALSTGVGFVNYTAHGSETSWADPSFTVSNVNALTNTNKYFLAIGNCCLSGNFGYSSPCFGEAMIRGANKAAYSYIGSCPNTYWYEDYYFGVGATNTFGSTPTQSGSSTGIYDAVWMDDTYNTVSSMTFLGNIAVCYAHAGNYQTSASPLYYWQAYHVLGDGSIMPYRVNPTANSVSHASTFPAGVTSFTVNAEAGSYVGISQNNTLLGAALVPASGSVNVPVTPVSSGQVKIVVTKPQRQPYIQDINVDGGGATYYLITATANPSNGGTVTGGGSYLEGSTCTLIATANTGYEFVNWSLNGVTVSTDPTYSFTVTEEAIYTANFEAEGDYIYIGDGSTSTNSYLPNYEFYNYSLTQQIYTADEIGTPGIINSIAFFYTGTASRTLDIYMVNTTVSSFTSNDDWITVTAADKVYSGSVTYTANAWNTFVLDTPFAYDGVSNLAVIVDDNTGSYVSSIGSYVFDATGMSLRVYSDGTNYDPLAPTLGTGAVLNVKNQLRLGMGATQPGGGNVVVEIGDGTSTTYVTPYNSLWGYSFVEQIYTAEEIGTAGIITSIGFNMQSENAQTNEIEVFMKNATRDSFASSTDYEPVTASNLVYSGTVTFESGWTTIFLDTPFFYDGSSNLVIGMHEYTPGYSTRYFYYTSASNMVLTYHSDSDNPDPYDLGSFSGSKYTSSNRANIQIGMMTGNSGELTVYDGSATNGYVPVYGFYADAYLKCEMVYPSSELAAMAGKDISKIKYYASTPASVEWTSTFQVFLTEVSDTNINEFVGLGTVVYEGLLNGTGDEMEITFSTPYHYNGGNLLVGVYNITTGNYKSVSWYGENVTGASVQGYSYSGLDAISPTQRDFLPKTTFNYLTGATNNLVATPDPIDLGYRPNGAWMRPMEVNIYNEGVETTLNGITVSNPFFQVEPIGFELPYTLGYNQSVNLNLRSVGTASGLVNANLIVNHGDNEETQFNVTATAYDPVSPDVWELAELVTSFPYTATLNANDVPLYDNYRLPPTNIADGADAVYKLVFTEDTYLNASVTSGENGKVALYPEDFHGVGGPDLGNCYTGPQIGGSSVPFIAMIGDPNSTTTSTYFPFHTLWNYSLAENLFLASELAEAGVTSAPMTSLSWNVLSTTCTTLQSNISIWMANVSDSELTSTSHITDGMTLVYTGENILPTVGWNEFVFNQGSFSWDGTSNVLIVCQRNNGSWQGSVSWQTHNPGFTGMCYAYNDNNAYDAINQTHSMTTSSTNRANIIMKANGGRNRNEVTYSFETGLDGWTVVDVNADQGTWIHSSENLGGYDYTTLAHSGTGFAMCYSYVDYVGAYNTDSYLVSPQKYYIAEGSTLTFWADNANDSYPENFSVCVTTANNPTANDFTQVWSGGAKGRSNAKVEDRHSNNRYNNWRSHSIDLSAFAGQEIWIAFHDVNYDEYEIWIDDITIVSNGGGNSNGVISDLTVTPGTYYLVASSTSDEFTVEINADEVPCPELATNPYPADAATEINTSVKLAWDLDSRTTEYRLMFGTTYYCEETLVDWTDTLSEHFWVFNLNNNTNYFWRIDQRNDGCPDGVLGQVWGFTTHLNIPQNLYAVDYTVFDDEQIVLYWDAVSDRAYHTYYVYRDGVKIGETQMNDINNTTFTDGPLAYNMNGYIYYVTAVYDEGESAPSNAVNVKVSGYGNVAGNVYEQDGTTSIAGAFVTMHGIDEFGVSHTYNFQTDSQGYYSGNIYAGSYNGRTACSGYQTTTEPIQGNPIVINYNQTTSPIDYILDESFNSVCSVIAEYYPDSLDLQSPYVKVYWGCGLPGEEIIEDFETGDFGKFDWQLDPTYPWQITTTNPYEGIYCMKSGNQQVLSSTSTMQVTVNIPDNGIMSFFGKISSESGWDYGYFYIDGVQMGSYTGEVNWAKKEFDITAGDHTFKWEYTEDFVISQGDDCFYVDYITFYKQPELAQPGWHTYCESEFNNAVGSNLTTTPSWAYEYPVTFLHNNYAGCQITKVSLFSDDMYGAVGGNYTCRIYVGGEEPASGTMVSELTVDVPSYQNAWVDWDLTTPVNVTGNDPIWVVWTANTTVSSWPAGCCGDLNDLGTWWEGGNGWEHLTYGTWTMRHWFTNRAGRSVAVGTADNAPAAVGQSTLNSNLRTYIKGDNSVNAVCVNPNAQIIPMTSNNTRAFSYYRVYRTDAYNYGPYTQDNTMLLADEMTDTLLIDVTWSDVEMGVYKYGVSCVYEGNRESQITWGETNQQPSSVVMLEGNDRDGVFSEDFDEGLPENWSTIDGGSPSGYGWQLASTKLGSTGYGHNGSDDCMISQSYDNNYGALYPDNYLITPQMPLGGIFSFWACAQDASYAAEHFGLAVSTSGNTDPNDFTMVQEWTMTAKAGNRFIKGEGMRNDENSDFRDQGNWYYYEIDLSEYAGQNGYIAIRHFNCSDMFYLNIDDVEYYFSSIQLPRESQIVWSYPISKDMMLGEGEVNITVTLNSGDSPEGTMVRFINQNSNEQQNYPMPDIVLDATGYYAWDSFRKGDYKVTITKEGYETISEQVSIWDATSLNYVMNEILYTVSDLYVSSTGWAMWNAESLPSNGDGDTFSVDFENGMPEGWMIIDVNGDGYTWTLTSDIPTTWTYYASLTLDWYHNGTNAICSGSFINGVGAITPDEYLISPVVNLTNGSQLDFWVAAADANYAADHFGVFVSTTGTAPSDFQSVQEWTLTAKREGLPGGRASREGEGLRLGTWYNYTVDLSAYAGNARYIAFRHFDCYDQYVMCLDDIALTNGAKSGERHLEYNQVVLTDTEDNVIFSGNTPDNYMQLPVEDLIEGETYRCKVSRVYTMGTTDWVEVNWVYQACDNYEGTSELFATTTEEGNLVSWIYPESRENQMKGDREMWDLMATFYAAEGGHYGVAYDGDNFYTSNWGYSSAAHNFYKYDLQGNMLEGFEIADCGTLRGMTYDGTYFYGVANSSTVYCVDLANHSLINTFTSSYGDMRGITYDPVRDGFWVIGNWSGNLTLIDHTGAIVQVGPEPASASDLAYYKDENNVEHVYCFNNSDNGVYDYNITTNILEGSVFNFSNTPGYENGTSGGCTVGNFNGKMAFIGDIQQSPNLIGIYELGEVGSNLSILGAMVYRDNELVGFTPDDNFLDEGEIGSHQYDIRVVYDGPAFCPNNNIYYSMSCPQTAFMGETFEIIATASPSEGGTITGAGIYGEGQTCTLTATANEDYTFINWTKDGFEVSTNATYSFTVTENAAYVAHFSSNGNHWGVDIYQYPYNMSVTGIIQINGVEQQTTAMEIGAFCGDVCRGTQRLTYFPQVDRYLVFLTLYGDAGDVMSFRLFDHSLDQELDLDCSATITFVPDGFIGTPFDPYVFDFGNATAAEQVSNFSEGYNWWSTYIEQDGIDGLSMLQEGLDDNGITIRSQSSGYTDYYAGYGWYGSLTSINNESSYRVITNSACTVTMTGNIAVPSEHPITLSQGWTWIGYVPSTTMDINVAMAGINAVTGDKLKSQQGYADYYPGYGWFGSLSTIEPGMGLMYYSTSVDPVTFTYPDNGKGGALKDNLTAENNHWVLNVYAYPDNMTVMAVVDLNDVELNSGHYELAAFANGECRGSVKLIFAEPLNHYVAFLTISGKDAAELSFRLYDTETGKEYYDAEESLNFVANAIVGDANDLYVVHFRGAAGMDEFANSVQVYPNPVAPGERFSIIVNAECKVPVRVEIVNALGATVSVETSAQIPGSIVAPITAGIYTVRIITEDKGTYCHKLVVK